MISIIFHPCCYMLWRRAHSRILKTKEVRRERVSLPWMVKRPWRRSWSGKTQNPAKSLISKVSHFVLGEIVPYAVAVFEVNIFLRYGWMIFDELDFEQKGWKSLWTYSKRQRFETQNTKLWRHEKTFMEQVVTRENPLMAVWNLWIDNRWLMDHSSDCILMESGIRNSAQSSAIFV